MTPAEVLVLIAGHGLNPSLRRLIEHPLDPNAWHTLVTRLDYCRLTPFALAATKSGVLPVTDEQMDDLTRQNAQAAARCRAASESLDEMATVLHRESIDALVLHGAATSALDYPPFLPRHYESVDVLIAPAEHHRAVGLLQEQGALRMTTDQGWPRRRRQAVRHRSANGVDVRLHPSLTPRRFGGPTESRDLFASREWFAHRGVRLSALGNEERLIAACIHARLDGSSCDLLVQRDVVQLVLRDDLSLRKVERLASSWRVEAVLADAVGRAWETFAVPDVVPISAWSRSYRPHRRDRRRLAAHPLAMPPCGCGTAAERSSPVARQGGEPGHGTRYRRGWVPPQGNDLPGG